jgi:cell division protein FtsI/penicillin-binding protein 2
MACGCKKNKTTETTNTQSTTQPAPQETTVKLSLSEQLQKQVDQIVETIKKIS